VRRRGALLLAQLAGLLRHARHAVVHLERGPTASAAPAPPAPVYETCEHRQGVAHVEASGLPAVYVFRDLTPWLTRRRGWCAWLREVAQSIDARRATTCILSGASIELPAELRPLAARLDARPCRQRARADRARARTFKDLNTGKALQ
jgi:hypothetical protein